MTDEAKKMSAVPGTPPQAEAQNEQRRSLCKEEAKRYWELGLAPIPLKYRSKEPALRELKPYLSQHATPQEIDSWAWEGVGIITGNVSGVIVLDVDGPEGEEELTQRGWTHPATAMVKTGKGRQCYFKHPGGDVSNRVRLATGLDLKADGGYVVAPPSVHPNGNTYKWIIRPEEGFAECPDWLLEAIGEPSARQTEPLAGPMTEGSRNDTLFRLACSNRRWGLPEGVISEAMHAVNRLQCQPPLADWEVNSIAKSAANYPAGSMQEQSPLTPPASEGLDFIDLGSMIEQGIEPPEELVRGFLYKAGIHSLYGPPGHGKTIVALWASLECIKQELTVFYVDEENGPLRVGELLQSFRANTEELSALFKYLAFPGLTLHKESLEMWEAEVADKKPALVVFDSFADMLALSNLDENNSIDVTSWVKAVCEPVKRSGGAVLILDHVAKDGAVTSARGSGAKQSKMDVAWGLKREKTFDRESTGVITLTRGKERYGVLQTQRKFIVGGDGSGKLVFSPKDAVAGEGSPSDKLPDKALVALEVLRAQFPNEAKAGVWQRATKDEMSSSTFYRHLDTLKVLGYVYEDENKYYRLSPASPL